MPYSIDKYSGSTVAVVEDGTINNTLDIKLIGKNYAGYGEAQNENFVWLLENFAGNSAPPRPIVGQLWYDTYSKRLRVYNGTSFKNSGGVEVAAARPIASADGELWYDTENKKLFAWSATAEDYILVGPQSVVDFGSTVMESDIIYDSVLNNPHPVIKATTDGNVVAIFSNQTFSVSSIDYPGFTEVKKGITLKHTNTNGESQNDYIFWGTASNADKLGGIAASKYAMLDNEVEFNGLVYFQDIGFSVGDDRTDKLTVSISEGGTLPLIRSSGNSIKFRTGSAHPMSLIGQDIMPGSSLYTSNIGSDTLRFGTVYASSFNGVATTATKLSVIGAISPNNYAEASVAATPFKIAVRDADGNITANTFLGTSSQASGLLIAPGTTIPAADFVHIGSPIFTSTTVPVTFADVGFRFGLSNKFSVTSTTDTLSFKTVDGANTPLTLKAADILPGVTNTSNIGSATLQYKYVYANTFYGSFNGSGAGLTNIPSTNISGVVAKSAQADTLLVSDMSNQYLSAKVTNEDFTIAVRGYDGYIAANLSGDVSGNLTGTVNGDLIGDSQGTHNGPVVGNVTGNVTGNLTGTASYAAACASADTAGFANTAGTVTVAAQPSITSVGTLNGLTVSSHILPNATSTINIGSSGVKFNNVYAVTFSGDLSGTATYATSAGSASSATYATSAGSITSQANSATITATVSNTGNAIVLRDGSGNFSANVMTATATAARYADLAEKYLADAEYEAGTVVQVGGEKEITIGEVGSRALGVISTNPAYMMNKDLEGGTYVALKGRVPCKVIGPIVKGARLVAAANGCATVANSTNLTEVFAIALESYNGTDPSVIEVVVL